MQVQGGGGMSSKHVGDVGALVKIHPINRLGDVGALVRISPINR
jgi:hypothetical protein